MEGYNSKFTGQQVDTLLEKAGSSYQKPETGIPQSDLDESTQQTLQKVDNKVDKEEGKGLSTNDFTDEYKAKVEDSASKEGYFPKMSVGIAANLAGRGEVTEQVFTYRPTDGATSIESGVAKIRRIKGNSVVWNQLVSSTTTSITLTNGRKYISRINGIDNYHIPTDDSSTLTVTGGLDNLFDLTQMFDAGNEPTTVEEFRALYPNDYYEYNSGELQDLNVSGIKTVGFNQWDEQWEIGGINANSGSNNNNTVVNIRSKNHTEVLPNTDYYFCSPSSTSTGIYYYDENKQYISHKWTNAKTIFTTPYDCAFIRFDLAGSYGTTYKNDICINLSHSGYRNGEYEPYKEITHMLPLSQITNGEPLRKAGSVYDEINEAEYIKRVGVRTYAEGDENDATLLTDGTNTNYPLAEPIVTPIETSLNLDYQAEDFGTEKALLTDNSAPFSADIVYQFNAVDRIRENSLDIADLLARVIALENAATSTTNIAE